jgi:Ca-activated chloride channel family protein
MLLAPVALILSVLAVPIILMYVLKLRRQEHIVPSTFLWRQALEDVQANAPWQRLRFNILLLLQLLALAALILALARPAYSRSHVIAGDLVVIVDESYGMQAHDVSPSRFGVALARARTLASELGAANVMSVIGMGAQPHLAIAASGDQGAIRKAIDGLRVGVDQPNFLETLSLAASLARYGQSTRAVVLTSRDSGIASLPLQVSFPVDIERIGGRLRDLGVTGFSASQGTSAVQAVARVSNFGSQTARSDLELFVDGHLADVRPLVVAGRREQHLFWTDIPSGSQRLQVHLTVADSVGTDKSAWAAVPAEPPRHLLLVSRGDFFLEAALADDPSVKLSVVPPSRYRVGMERAYDLAIFDGFFPPALPTSSTLVIAPPAGRFGPMRFAGNLPAGTVDASSASPLAALLRYVDLSDVHVAQVRSVTLPGWMQPLSTANGHTVLAAGEQGNARFALVSFDLQHSDWPLRVSFPVMLQNLLHYLAPGLTLGQTTINTGQAVTFFPPPGTRVLDVVRPDGGVEQLKPPFPPFTDTSRPGPYTVKAVGTPSAGAAAAGRQAAFAVNFFPARPAPAAGPATIHAGHVQVGKTLTASVPISVIWVFEMVALLLLALEWWITFRGRRLL